jgi:hypothetical protein
MSERPLPPMVPYPDPAPERVPAGQDVPKGRALFFYVLDHLKEGEEHEEIEHTLIRYGYSVDEAARIVADVADRRRHFLRAQTSTRRSGAPEYPGRTNMIVGGIICVVGVVITAVAFALASQNGRGGGYIVAWGAIIFGGIQFIRGLLQSQETD